MPTKAVRIECDARRMASKGSLCFGIEAKLWKINSIFLLSLTLSLDDLNLETRHAGRTADLAEERRGLFYVDGKLVSNIKMECYNQRNK